MASARFTDERLDRMAADMRAEMGARRANVALMNASALNPPQARRDANLRRATGFPAQSFDDTTRSLAETRQRQNEAMAAMTRAPALMTSLLFDPRRFERAADDLDNLAAVSEAARRNQERARQPSFRERLRANQRYYRDNPMSQMGLLVTLGASARDIIAASGSWAGEAMAGLAQGTIETLEPAFRFGNASSVQAPWLPLTTLAIRGVTGRDLPTEATAGARMVGDYYRRQRQASTVDYGNRYANAAVRGIESVPAQVVALVAAARGNPQAGVAILSGLTGGTSYREGRESGMPVHRALAYAATDAGLEAVGEALPVFGFASDVANRTGFTRTLLNQLVQENVGEQVTAHLQDFNRWTSIEANRGKSFASYLSERPQAMLDTFIATTAAVGLQTGGAFGMNRAIDGYAESRFAEAASRNIGRVMEAASRSRLRQESPEDFRQILAEQIEGAPGDTLYVPAEAVRSLFQSPEDLADDVFWGGYADQVFEAEALGGDVVVPLAHAATALAGTPQWEAIKDHVRATPGGMSRAEAAEWETAFEDAVRKTAEEYEALVEADRAKMEPVQKVWEAMRDKLMLAGYRPDVASHLATGFTQRQRVRSERLGRDLTGDEADTVEIRQVLPEKLSGVIRAAEVPDAGLRAVITEMRRKRGARSDKARFGPSLLDWIVSQGGIEDRGGDIAAMGGGRIKGRAKKGQRKIIRAHDPDQAMLIDVGKQNTNTPGELALRAWEAGYFPEHAERPDVNALLDAIAEGLSGRDRFVPSEATDEDNLRDAAQQLYALLDQQGVDPETATPNEIAKAVQRYQAERMEGRGYEQLAQRGVVSEPGNQYDIWHYVNARPDELPLRRNPEAVPPRRGGRIRALGIADDLRREGSTALVGREAATPQDLADLAQVYRDPRFETLRVFFTKGDTIVHATGVSTRSVGSAPLLPEGLGAFNPWLSQTMQEADADGFYLLHNHPSGDPSPSLADVRATKAAAIPGFRGHVVINSNKFATIDSHGSVEVVEKDYGEDALFVASRPDPVLGAVMGSHDDLVRIGKVVQQPGLVTVIGTDNRNRVRVIADYSEADLARPEKVLLAAMRALSRRSGSGRLFLIGSEDVVRSEVVRLAVRRDVFTEAIDYSGRPSGMEYYKGSPVPSFTEGPAAFVAETLFQSTFNEGPRGRITFTEGGKHYIDLFESRDLSTFIHESGHLYLEELMADAKLALEMDTPEARQLFADWETIKAWFKREGHPVGEDGTIPTEAHELFARGFERFAMEGKAPSSALRRAFEAFRSWLLTIYKVTENLRAPITPEVRDVMARLIATDEEIAAAAEEQNIKALFNSAEEANMTQAEYGAYRTATEEARSEAHDALIYRTMAAIRSRKTKEYRAQEANVRAEISEAVDAQPVFRAMRLLRTGKINPGDEARKVKLDRQWLVDTYGADALDALPKSVPPIYGDRNTIHPDVIAEEAGFTSGDEMVRTLMGMEEVRKGLRANGDNRSPRQAQIDELTQERMAERYGDPLNDGSIEQEALELIHNDRQGEVIASEIRALARRANKKPTPYAIARKWAADKIAAGKVSDVASGAALEQYRKSARRAAKLAEEAMLKGDVNETYRQKQAQMLNNALLSEGKKAKDRVDVAVRRLGKLARKRTMPSVDQDYLDQAHALLEQVEFKTRSQASLERQQGFEEWAREQEAAGHDVVAPVSFVNSLGLTHWSRLLVEELIGLDDTVQQIIHLGRLKQTILDGRERRAAEEVIVEMQAAGGDLKQRPPSALNDPDRNFLQATKSKLRGIDAAMIKIEQLCEWLDGGKENGVFTRIIWRPIAEAQGREADLMRQYVAKVNEAIDAMPKKQLKDWNRAVDTPELINRIPGHPEEGRPWSFFKDQIVMMAMNMGNEGNRQRLMDGYGWSETQLREVLDRLMTAEDWAFVQKVWDIVDELWPDLSALERRVNGFAPDKVEAVPVETPFGTFRGGYFPAIYDPRWSSKTEREREGDLLERGYTRANVRAGAANERALEVKRPILLSLEVITRHLGEVIHDITHREALTQVWRVVSDPRVERTITNAMGPEYAKLFRPWLKHVANDQARNANSNSMIVKAFRRIRTNVTLVGLGYRFTSTVAQVAGMPNIIAKIGTRRMGEGWLRFLANPASAYREVTEKSAEMRDRFSTMDRDIVERARQYKGLTAITGPSWFTRYAYHGILIMDSILTTAGWIGAYRKATADGMSEEEAVHYADKVIRLSQGAGGTKDQAAIMAEHPAVTLFTMFFSYFSALYSQQRDVFHRALRITDAKDAGTVLHRAFWVIIMPPLIDAMIKGEGPSGGDDDEEEGWAKGMARRILVSNLASIPGIRDIVSAADSGFGYRVSPVSNIGESAIRGVDNLRRVADNDPETEPSQRWLKQTLTLLGLLTGRPTGQIATTSQFALDVSTGEQEPETAEDYYRGVTSGRVDTDR